jgi:dihydropyrimidinase
VHAETCQQYITLTADDMKGLNIDMSGAKYVCSPPPRDKESQDAIWEGIIGGVFQTFSADHCPFRYDDPKGKLTPNSRTSFRWVPNGIPGVETRLPIFFSEGVSKGRISLQKFVELTSTNHARIYGLYPRKGSIGVGFDADIVLWDPKLKKAIRQSDLHHGSDYTPWEGFDRLADHDHRPGQVAADNGQIAGTKGAAKPQSRKVEPDLTGRRAAPRRSIGVRTVRNIRDSVLVAASHRPQSLMS